MRTGSTLLFQVMSELALMHGGRYAKPEAFAERFVERWAREERVVIKAHTFHAALKVAPHTAIVTVRDPRDVVVSLMHFRNESFEQVVETRALLGWLDSYHSWHKADKLCVVKYESLTQQPVWAVCQIAEWMDCPVSEAVADYIVRKWSKEQNALRSQMNLPLRSRYYFSERHINRTAIQSWRDLEPGQIEQLHAVVGGWLEELGYES